VIKRRAPLCGEGILTRLAFTPDGKTLAVGGDGTIRLWEGSE
jgi:WD40 repeat protein